MRENFVTFGLHEVLDIPSNNDAPFQLLWELANEADGNNFSDYKKLKSFQKINHFPGVRELGNKRKLQRNMRNAVKKYGFDVFDVFPLSFRVPKEKLLFENMHTKLIASHQDVTDAHRQNISWILKISGKDRAEGIRLIQSPKELRRQKGIVQQYIKIHIF